MAVIKKETARIEVLDAHGSKLQVVEYQDFHSTTYLDGKSDVRPGLKYYENMNREKLNVQSETQFQVIKTGEILTRI